VVLYGELLPADVWQKAVQAVEKCDLMLIAGSSLEVAPVSGLPIRALKNGVKLIIINNDPTNVDSQAAEVIHQDVVKALPEIEYYVLK
jgi:NAD-dependent deacetylase